MIVTRIPAGHCSKKRTSSVRPRLFSTMLPALRTLFCRSFHVSYIPQACVAPNDEYRTPYAPVLTIEQATVHPHLRERGVVRRINDRFLGEFDVPGFTLCFSQHPPRPLRDVPNYPSTMNWCCANTWVIRRDRSCGVRPHWAMKPPSTGIGSPVT